MRKRRIRVMHLIHQLGAGGAENGIVNLANHIDQERFQMAVCAFVRGGVLTRRLDKGRIALFEAEKSPGNDLGLPVALVRLFRQWKPDIVHTHAWGTLCEGVAAARIAGVPSVVHGEHGTIQRRRRNLLVQRTFWRLTDRVLSVSSHHASELASVVGFPESRITVLPNGVDNRRFHGARRGRQSVRDSMGFGGDDIAVGTVGRLVPVKNQRLLIDAFSRLPGPPSRRKLVVVGDGPLENALRAHAENAGCADRVRFPGRRSDIPEVMAAMDIFALPSLSEGMSNTILEAMSSRLPVIATAVGGNPELVVDGVTGMLVPTDDADAMARALAVLVQDAAKRKAMGDKGRERVLREFSLDAMVRNYQALYLDCLNQPNRRRWFRRGRSQ